MLLPPTDPCLKAHLFSREWLRVPAHSLGCLDPSLLAPIRSASWLPKVLVVQAGKQGINGGEWGGGFGGRLERGAVCVKKVPGLVHDPTSWVAFSFPDAQETAQGSSVFLLRLSGQINQAGRFLICPLCSTKIQKKERLEVLHIY